MDDVVISHTPYDANTIADWFIARNRVVRLEQDSESLSNLKLQKLLYYAQGAYLAIYDTPLFSNEIEAWKHGPVVREVYFKFNEYGSAGIPDELDVPQTLTSEVVQILEEVFDEFGQYSAWKLRNMTHEERPWLETPRDEVIEQTLIKEYFLEEYVS